MTHIQYAPDGLKDENFFCNLSIFSVGVSTLLISPLGMAPGSSTSSSNNALPKWGANGFGFRDDFIISSKLITRSFSKSISNDPVSKTLGFQRFPSF